MLMKLIQFDNSSKMFEPIDLVCRPAQEIFLVILSLFASFLRKIVHTMARIFVFGLATLRVVGTLFSSLSARDWFIEQASALAADLADWLIWPFCASLRLLRSFFRFVFN
jgi:hypothetical protein